jgi:thioester reductase-like protein
MQNTVFITGGTGLVGADIIRRLLRDERVGRVIALVRGNGAHACPRLVEAVQQLEEFPLGAGMLEKLTVVCGDITLEHFGWPMQDWQACARRVTHIIHSAADVRFHLPLDEARRVNVGGTRTMLAFAAQASESGSLRHFSYVSTAYVCGDRIGRVKEDDSTDMPHFTNNYEQSKWESEQLVRAAMTRIPSTIFRPSIIVGDARTGRTNAFKALYVPLRLIVRGMLREVPPVSAPLDVVPVDYVGSAICHVALGCGGIGQTLHLTAGAARSSSAAEIARSALRAACTPVQAGVPGTESVQKLPHVAAQMLEAFIPYMTQLRDFDDSNARRALAGSGITVPALRSYIDVIIGFCLASCWGKRLPQAA